MENIVIIVNIMMSLVFVIFAGSVYQLCKIAVMVESYPAKC